MKRILVIFLLSCFLVVPVRAAEPVVQAVLFYSPTCPHCHVVINEVLPTLAHRYGEQLQIAGVDVSTAQGGRIYNAAVVQYQIPRERLGVPMMLIGNTVLVGSQEIPEVLPRLIEAGLQQGGTPWPDLPGLAAYLPQDVAPPAEAPAGQIPAGVPQTPMLPPIMRDMPANAIAVAVLFGMIVVVIWAVRAWRHPQTSAPAWRDRAVPLLALLGMGVAIYLALVETAQATAVCGPIGDCATVQQSAYARLFGVPIGIIGVVGYLAILAAWFALHLLHGNAVQRAGIVLVALIGAGTLFSIYLTFLEPFVIGATCAWCLTSAILMSLLLWLTAPYHGNLIARLPHTPRRTTHTV